MNITELITYLVSILETYGNLEIIYSSLDEDLDPISEDLDGENLYVNEIEKYLEIHKA